MGKGSGNSRNGTRAKTVLTDIGPVEVRVPLNAFQIAFGGRLTPANH